MVETTDILLSGEGPDKKQAKKMKKDQDKKRKRYSDAICCARNRLGRISCVSYFLRASKDRNPPMNLRRRVKM